MLGGTSRKNTQAPVSIIPPPPSREEFDIYREEIERRFQEKTAQLEDLVALIASTDARTEERIAASEQKIRGEFQTNMAKLEGQFALRLNKMDMRIRECDVRYLKTEALLQKTVERVNAVEARLGQIDTDLQTVRNVHQETETRLDTRIDELQSKHDGLDSEFRNAEEAAAALTTRVTEQEQFSRHLQERLVAFEDPWKKAEYVLSTRVEAAEAQLLKYETSINIAAARLKASEQHAKQLAGDALRRSYPQLDNLFELASSDEENFYFICEQIKPRTHNMPGETAHAYHFEVALDVASVLTPANMDAPFSFDSRWIKLQNSVDAFLRLERTTHSGDIRVHVYLRGFRGSCEYTVSMFRFAHGAPKKMVITPTWTRDEGFVLPKFLTSQELQNGYINEWDGKVHMLVTAVLKWKSVTPAIQD